MTRLSSASLRRSVIELRGFLRLQHVTQAVDMWLREDGANDVRLFSNVSSKLRTRYFCKISTPAFVSCRAFRKF
jgi:hypothetical protein